MPSAGASVGLPKPLQKVTPQDVRMFVPSLALPTLPLGALPLRGLSPVSPRAESSRLEDTGRWEDHAAVMLERYSHLASRVLPWLYVSGSVPAGDLGLLHSKGIVLVINTAGEVVANAFEGVEEAGISYLTLALRDGPFEDLGCLFSRVCGAIEVVRRGGGSVLLCCHMGVSRSATFAIAYLIWAASLPYTIAYDYLRLVRPVVSPNPGFTCQLVEWQVFLASLNQGQPLTPRHQQALSSPRGGGMGMGTMGTCPPLFVLRAVELMGGCRLSGRVWGGLEGWGATTTASTSGDGGGGGGGTLTHALTIVRNGLDRGVIEAQGEEWSSLLKGIDALGPLLYVTRWDDLGGSGRVSSSSTGFHTKPCDGGEEGGGGGGGVTTATLRLALPRGVTRVPPPLSRVMESELKTYNTVLHSPHTHLAATVISALVANLEEGSEGEDGASPRRGGGEGGMEGEGEGEEVMSEEVVEDSEKEASSRNHLLAFLRSASSPRPGVIKTVQWVIDAQPQ